MKLKRLLGTTKRRTLKEHSPVNSALENHNTTMASDCSVWVFGYGSLCWNPGFEYSQCIIGYVPGYVRRFWQGNTTHRGTEEKPGLVATLVPDDQGLTYGCAFKVTGPDALEYLENRECSLGGYLVTTSKFYPHNHCSPWEVFSGEAFPVQLYIATEQSRHWHGEAPLPALAEQICESSGPSGHNVEYVLRLAQFIRTEIPEIDDCHLFELEALIHRVLEARNIDLNSVMGRPPPPHRRRISVTAIINHQQQRRRRRTVTFKHHRSRVPQSRNNQPRCLKI